jgi:hypothetical protein
MEQDNYGARTLIREIVLSIPFRNGQSDAAPAAPAPPPPRKNRRLLGDK